MTTLASVPSGKLESGRPSMPHADLRAVESDQALIAAIGRGDRDAMTTLYRRHHVRVYRFALRIVNDMTSAEDVVSDVFLEVWRQAGRFAARARVSTWLLAIARNKGLSLVAKRRSAKCGNDSIESDEHITTPEVTILAIDRTKLLRRCVSQLSVAHREIIDLVYYHHRSVGEVAEIVGVPAGTVKTRMFHARRHLRVLLEAAGYEGF